jgi:heptosyltransferase III
VFILTVRNDGLGDLILSLPTLAALRRAHPAARLGVVVRPQQAPLLELYGDDVEVWPDDAESAQRLKRERPDVVLFLRPDRAWAARAFAARVKRRIGTRHRWQSLFFNERVSVRRRDSGRHEAECNLQVAAPLGVAPTVPPVRLTVPDRCRLSARIVLSGCGLSPGAPYVAVHPGSHSSAPNWPAGHYAGLVQRLSELGKHVLVTGGTRERELVHDVAGALGHAVDPTDLGTLAAVLQGASTVVSGSTGPMHLAAALGVPVVALFSSRSPHAPSRWGPLGDTHRVLQCDPVVHADGTTDLASLDPALVVRAVEAAGRAPRVAT